MSWIRASAASALAVILLLIAVIPVTAADPLLVELDSEDLEGIAGELHDYTEAYTLAQQAAAAAAGEMNGIIRLAVEVALALAVIVVAFWQNKIFVHVAAGLGVQFLSLTWIGEYTGVAVVFIGLALYLFLEAVLLAVVDDGGARGWSELKQIFGRVIRR